MESMRDKAVRATERMSDANYSAADLSAAGSFERYVEHIPAAFAVTRGDKHTLLYANAAFRNLVANDNELLIGRPVADAFATRDTAGLTALLDRAFRTGIVSRDRRVELVDESALLLSCTIWPDVNGKGESEHLVIELRKVVDDGPVRRELRRVPRGTNDRARCDAQKLARDARIERQLQAHHRAIFVTLEFLLGFKKMAGGFDDGVGLLLPGAGDQLCESLPGSSIGGCGLQVVSIGRI